MTPNAIREPLPGAVSDALSDRIALAKRLYETGRLAETLDALEPASALDLTEVERGLLLNEQARYSFLISGANEKVLALSEQAISLLRDQPLSTDGLIATANSAVIVANILLDRDRPRAIESVTYAACLLDSALATGSGIDPVMAFHLCEMASRAFEIADDPEESGKWKMRALDQPIGAEHQGLTISCRIQLGRIHRMAGRFQEARSTFDQARDILVRISALEDVSREIKQLGFEFGALSFEAGQHRDAAITYRNLLGTLPEGDPDFQNCLLALARSEAAAGRYDEAREYFMRLGAWTGREEFLDLRYSIALRDYEAADYVASIAELQSLLSDETRSGVPRCNIVLLLGHAYVSTRCYPQAAKCYDEVIACASAAEEQKTMARVSVLAMRYDAAARDYQAGRHKNVIAKLEPLLTEQVTDDLAIRSRLLLAHAYSHMKDFARARAHYERVAGAASASEEVKSAAQAGLLGARYGVAVQAYQAQRYATAISELESMLYEQPPDELRARINLLLGGSYVRTQCYLQALTCYQRVADSTKSPQESRDKANECIQRLRSDKYLGFN